MRFRKLAMQELGRPSAEQALRAGKLPLSLVLDDIRSANNVGSLFRTADALGLKHVYLCGITATPPHRDILKTALGATDSVAWSYREDCTELIHELRGGGARVHCLEQTENSTPLQNFSVEAERELVLVVGNEVRGVQQEVIEASDGTIEIEQFGSKHSLNVAVSAGMALWALSQAYPR
jgi:tRNA G18 (ribose-2'-O)-methylase SpoU